MAGDTKSFKDLLDQAPIAADTVSLTGMLARSPDAGKFVLTLADGRKLTLETDAVKDYAVLGGAIGQTVVRVDIDSSRAPKDAAASPEIKAPPTIAWLDNLKNPILDTHPGQFPDVTIPIVDATIGPGAVALGGNPWGGSGASQTAAPFALATPHQVAQAQLAAIQAMLPYTYNRGPTLPWPIGWGGNDPILHSVLEPVQ